MTWPDAVNGAFELVGGLVIWRNVLILVHDREVRGISIFSNLPFMLWGIWNIAYYPMLHQTLSMCGALVTTSGNLAWTALAIRHRR